MTLLKQYGAGESEFSLAKEHPELALGRVISQSRTLYRVIAEGGERLAEVSGSLRAMADDPSMFPAVGDFVLTDPPSQGGGSAIIRRILPRRSAFVRMAPGGTHKKQVVAANIDVAFVCMSLNQNYSLRRLERYLAAAWESGATPVAVLTKADLCPDPAAALAELEAAVPGTEAVVVSAMDGNACEAVLRYVSTGVTATFLGSSGVGKSTLINRLLGEARMETSEIREDGKGRHTTTRRELIPLPGGGVVIDTPGMRALEVDGVDLERSFADIEELAAQCRFTDCGHGREPGCAVQRAVQEGRLDAARLENYMKLRREANYEGLSARNLERSKLNSMFAGVGGMKSARKYIRENDKRRK